MTDPQTRDLIRNLRRLAQDLRDMRFGEGAVIDVDRAAVALARVVALEATDVSEHALRQAIGNVWHPFDADGLTDDIMDAIRPVVSSTQVTPVCETCGGSAIIGTAPDGYMNCPDCNPDPTQHPDDRTDDRATQVTPEAEQP